MLLRLRNHAGLNLIELLFAMGVMSILATGIFKLFMAYHTTYWLQQSQVDGLQNGRIGLATLARELRGAGYGLLDTNPAALAGGQSCHPWTSSRSYELLNEHSIRILLNLHGVDTRLIREALPGDTELIIPDDPDLQDHGLIASSGRAFEPNDTIYIYRMGTDETLMDLDVECHKLTSNGSSGRIRLGTGDPIRRPLPVGSPIHVVNELRYFLNLDKKRLMRRLDGGTDVLSDGVEDLVFKDLGNRVSARLILKGMDPKFSNRMLPVEISVTLRNR